MNEKKWIRREFIRSLLLFILAFSCIYSVLGLLIYGIVRTNLYASVDEILLADQGTTYAALMMEEGSVLEAEEPESGDVATDQAELIGDLPEINPRVLYIARDRDGSPLYYSDINGDLYEELYKGFTFNSNELDTLYFMTLGGRYHYRAINRMIEKADGQKEYLQILINVDAEDEILRNVVAGLAVSLGVAVFLSAGVGWLLSRRILKPVTEAYQKQTEFVQNASHELRTPLTIIRTTQELLLSNPESRIIDKFEAINRTIDETRRLTKMTEDLILLAMTDTSQTKLQKEPVSLEHLLSGVGEAYCEIAGLEGKKMRMDFRFKGNIEADSDKLRQLAVILLDNSFKYTEPGDSIAMSTEEKDGNVVLRISDTGIGISDEDMRHVFERFYRADKARSRQTGGSGLGLTIAENIALLHGGSIQMRHHTPKGVEVIVKLPA